MNESAIQRAIEAGDPDSAAEAIKEIDLRLRSSTDGKERANLLLNKAVFNGILRRFDESRKQLALALEQAPEDPDIHIQYDFIEGSLYDQEGKPSEAFVRLTAMLSNYSERLAHPAFRFMYEDLQLRRGLALARLESFGEAIPLLKEALSFDLAREHRSDVLSNLGLCYLELREFELAKDRFLEAAAIGLTREWVGQVHFGLGVTYFYTNLFQEAKREFRLCEEHAAEYQLAIVSVYAWLSRVCKLLGEGSESERYARLAKVN